MAEPFDSHGGDYPKSGLRWWEWVIFAIAFAAVAAGQLRRKGTPRGGEKRS